MNAIVATPPQQQSLVTKFANRFGVEPNRMLTTLKATAFRQRKADVEITNEQMMALLVVADQYGLNPWTKEIFAFEDKGAIIPVVSVDGWARIINSHPELDGIEFRYSDTIDTLARAKPCPVWCEVIIYRKDRSRPIVVREHLDEVYQPPRGRDGGYDGPWQSHTKRMLRHKVFIQGARLAFGFGGIYDEDEADRIIEGQARVISPAASADLSALESGLRAQTASAALSHSLTEESYASEGVVAGVAGTSSDEVTGSAGSPGTDPLVLE